MDSKKLTAVIVAGAFGIGALGGTALGEGSGDWDEMPAAVDMSEDDNRDDRKEAPKFRDDDGKRDEDSLDRDVKEDDDDDDDASNGRADAGNSNADGDSEAVAADPAPAPTPAPAPVYDDDGASGYSDG